MFVLVDVDVIVSGCLCFVDDGVEVIVPSVTAVIVDDGVDDVDDGGSIVTAVIVDCYCCYC